MFTCHRKTIKKYICNFTQINGTVRAMQFHLLVVKIALFQEQTNPWKLQLLILKYILCRQTVQLGQCNFTCSWSKLRYFEKKPWNTTIHIEQDMLNY